MLVAQLSDPHIGADWDGADPVPGLVAAVRAANVLEPDAVLVSGDLTEHASDAEYETVRELLAPLTVPVHVLPGNHDERAALRRHFDLPGSGAEPVHYAADLGALRLVVTDSTIPGEDGGRLDATWLDAALAEAPDVPTIVATHHPPLLTGVPAMDAIGVPAGDRAELAHVLERHPQVRRLVAGHVHRTVAAGRVLAVPSTYRQLRLDFTTHELLLSREPPAFAVHALLDGDLTSHVRQVQAGS